MLLCLQPKNIFALFAGEHENQAAKNSHTIPASQIRIRKLYSEDKLPLNIRYIQQSLQHIQQILQHSNPSANGC